MTTLVLVVPGKEMTATEALKLDAILEEQKKTIKPEETHLVLDMCMVSYVSASCIGVLAIAAKDFGKMTLRNCDTKVSNVLCCVDMDKYIEIQ